MDKNLATDLRALIDHLALRGVAMLSVRQGEERLRIILDPASSQPQSQAQPEPATITAPGPGIFHARHPSGAGLACLEAGDFLFPVATICEGDEILEQHGAVVGFSAPLIRKKGTP